MNEDTFRGWVSRYQQLGAAGLIDQRGAHGERLPVDPRLWGKVLAGLARGEPVAAIHRELTPEARRLGATWPGLRALQIKVRAARAVVARNAHLFTGISGN